MQFNFADCFELVADTVPERIAVVSGDRRLTYAELDERSTRFAHVLEFAGATRRTSGLYVHNQAEHLEAMMGCYKRRAVPINVNYRYGPAELTYLFDDAEISALVYGAEYREIVTALLPHLPKLRVLIEVGDGDSTTRSRGRRAALRVGARAGAYDAFSRPGRPTTTTCSTPAARPACRRASCGGRKTCSSRRWAAGTREAHRSSIPKRSRTRCS